MKETLEGAIGVESQDILKMNVGGRRMKDKLQKKREKLI